MRIPDDLRRRLAIPPDGAALARRKAMARTLAGQLPEGPLAAEGEALDALAGGAPLLCAGQQAGLLTGPAYTLHKALALVSLKRRLEDALGEPVCALFWVEGNDHDWIEAARVDLPGHSEWKPAPPPGGEGRSVGRIPLTGDWLAEARAALVPRLADDPAGEAARWLDFRDGESLAAAFTRRLRELFGETGLLPWDPSTETARRASKPFFERLHADGAEVQRFLSARAVELAKAGRPVPVEIDDRAPWFEDDEQGRRRRATFEAPLADADRVTPNVLSRPLLQDWLFSPALTLLGPGELAYHAQFEGLEGRFGIEPPLRRARPRLQWLRQEDGEALRTAGLDPWSPPQPGSPWPESFLSTLPGGAEADEDAARLAKAADSIGSVAARWDERAGRSDLAPLAERARATTGQLVDRIRSAHRSAHKPLLRELHDRGRWQDGPAGPQERRVNGAALWLRLGGDRLLEPALAALDPFESRQQRLIVDPAAARIAGKETGA